MTALSWQSADVLRAVEDLGGRLPVADRGPVASVVSLGFSPQVASVGLLGLVEAERVVVEGPWLRVVGT